MNRLLRVGTVLSVLLVSAQAQGSAQRAISIPQAKSLVLKALSAEQKRLSGLGAERYQDPHSSRFFFFTVFWAAGPGQSVVVGNYAVDPYTGDVWSAARECGEIRNPDLQKFQRRVRESLGLSDAMYLRLKTKGPLCER